MYSYFVQEPTTYNILVRIVRGKPRDPLEKDINLITVEEFISKLERGLQQGAYHGHAVYPMSDLITARETIGRQIQLKVLRENHFQIPCYAANLIGVIKSNGDVMACELRDDKLGNIRDFDCDFKKLWLSQKARAISKDIIENKCFCTHECFMSTNILFNPRLYPRLVSEVAKLRWDRSKHKGSVVSPEPEGSNTGVTPPRVPETGS